MTAPLIGEYMTRAPYSIGSDQSLRAAAERMDELQIRHLPVLHGGELIGIVSERDIALVESLPGVDSEQVTVTEAMTAEPYHVTPNARVVDVVREMARHRWGAALVTENGKLVGVFTTTDALDALVQLVPDQAA